MHVLVKAFLTPVAGGGQCTTCQAVGAVFRLSLSIDLGMNDSEVLCFECLKKGTEVEVAQPDMRPGRTPPSKKIKRLSQRQERELAERIGGRAQRGSGAVAGARGDVRKQGVVRVESKLTQSKTYGMSRDILDKIRAEAAPGEIPSLHVQFLSRQGRVEDEWVAVPVQDWEEKIANGSGKD